MRRRPARVPTPRPGFTGFRFPPAVIMVAVRWYLRYALSYREVEELLAERGIEVDHVTVYRWVQRFTPLLIDAARPCRHVPGDRWFVDETVCQSRRTMGLSVPSSGLVRAGHRRPRRLK
jgi:transposase, IS6 family